MKNFRRTAALAAITLAAAGSLRAADITGRWKSEFDSPVGHLQYTYEVKADGEKLTGKAIRELDGEKTETELKEGKVAGDAVSFVEVLKRDDQEIRIDYTGKLKDDEIKFTRKVGDIATMEIVARREPAAGRSPTATPAAAKKIALKFVRVDSQETSGEDGKGANAVDGNTNTFWHTQWEADSPRPPHEIVIELSPPSRIKGFTYLPRQDEEDHGMIKDYEFYVSDDGKEFGKPVKKGTLSDSRQKQAVTFDAVSCRFIKLRALSEINDEAWTSLAELDVVAE